MNIIIGQQYGKYIVQQKDKERVQKGEIKRPNIYYLCLNLNTNEIESKRGDKIIKYLNNTNIKSPPILRKINIYYFYKDYVEGVLINSDFNFLIDLEDYDLIKNYRWKLSKDGYVVTSTKEISELRLHRLILSSQDIIGKTVDHIDKNKLNCRKNNLRLTDNYGNSKNHKTRSTNKTGITGVYWIKDRKIYTSVITINNKKTHLCCSKNIEDCIKARLQAEKEYYGEFAPQQHLFKQYGIE